ncbi:MAG: SEC-C domain-containing protein [Candidatus Auribacterota bacterium]|nr:SEC-C domain-containing protein [Candidatus Auribacterota bacterium]
MEEYSEKEFNRIRQKCRSWFKEFSRSDFFSRLNIEEQDDAWSVIDYFAGYLYSYLGLPPEEWDEESLEECCLEILPEKLSAEIEYFGRIAPVLNVFFLYLGEKGKLENGLKLARRVEGLNDDIVRKAADPGNWGMAKSFVMHAREEGIDPTDREEMSRFIHRRNNDILDDAAIPREPHPLQFLPPSPPPGVGVNDPCPCGSGKKYKKCCMHKYKKKTEPVPEPERGGRWVDMVEDAAFGGPAVPDVGRLSIMRTLDNIERNPESLKRLEENAEAMTPGITRIKPSKDKIQERWNLARVEEMSSPEIIAKLKDLNIDFDRQLFKRQVRNFNSAVQLADERYYPLAEEIGMEDDDFIWLAIIELWRRYIPRRPNIEMIDDGIQAGYYLVEENNYPEAMKVWRATWNGIKKIIPRRIKSIEEADYFLYEPLTQSIYNWSGDYEMELYNAGLEDKSYFRNRIQYCWEFRRKFPESDESFIYNMLQGEAESWGALGKIREADRNFQRLIKRFPENALAYAAWGDLYSNDMIYRDYDKSDYNRAEEIYRLGLERCDSDLDALEDRIKRLSETGVD